MGSGSDRMEKRKDIPRMKNKEQFIFGWHPVMEALEAKKEVQKIFLLQGTRNERSASVMKHSKALGIPVQFVPGQKLDRITRKNHQGVIAILSPIEFAHLDNLVASVYERGELPRFLACDGITDVRNFGAICRSAECFGFHGVLVPARGMAPLNEDAIKTSSGALLRIPVCRLHDFVGELKALQKGGVKLIGMTEKGASDLHEIRADGPTCVVMGNEETGLSAAMLSTCDELVRIPMAGKTLSLNVSVSAGIAMFKVMQDQQSNVD